MLSSSSLHITAIVVSTLSFLLVIPVWMTLRKSRHHHHALSFMLAWVLLGSILTILSEILLEPETFPFALFNPPSPSSSSSSSTPDISSYFPGISSISSDNPTTAREVTIASNSHPRKKASPSSHPLAMSTINDTLFSLLPLSLSGFSTLQLTEFITIDSSERAESILPLQFCVLSAHLLEAVWLGICLALMQWGWRLYRTTSRDSGVSRSGGDPPAKVHPGSESASWTLVRVLLVAPFAITAVAIQTGLEQCIHCFLCCCCCYLSRPGKRVADLEWGEQKQEQRREGANDSMGLQHQYEMDKRSCSTASDSEDVCGVSEGGAGSTHGLTANASSVIPDHPTRKTFGAFFRASRFDKQRARDGRSNTCERRACPFKKGSWMSQRWDQCTRLETIAQDVVVCFGLPSMAFLPIFFVSAEARSYEVQPWWGGCRISSGSGHGDDRARLLALQVLITAMTLSGFLLACFAIQSFRKRGSLENTFKLADLTSPSSKIPRECKSTRTIGRHLALCLCLTSVLLLSRIVPLAVTVYELHTAAMQLSAPATRKSSFSAGIRPPLFRLGDHDHGMLDVPIFFCLVVVSFLVLLWTQLVEWVKSAFCRCFPSSAKDLQAMDDDDDEVISVRRRSFNSAAMIPKQQHVRTEADARRSESRYEGGRGAVGAAFSDHGQAVQSVDSGKCPLESTTLGDSAACGSSPGSTPLLPISKAFIQERIEQSSRNPSWPVSSVAQDGSSLIKATRGGRMMGQYLQQSRRTASQSELGLGMSPLLPAAPFPTWSTSSHSFGSPLVQGGSLGVPRITVNGTEYDRVLEQLVKKTLVGQGGGSNELAGGHEDEEEEEEYGIETMCPVSLEGLVYDDVDDVMAGCERGERAMEMALADSSEIRGIDMGSLSSLIRQEDVDQPSSGCCQGNEGGGNQRSVGSSLPVELDTTAFHTRLQGDSPSSKKNIIGSSNSNFSYVRTRTDHAVARDLPLPPAPRAAPPTLPLGPGP